MNSKKNKTVAKGYRLKPKTHTLIKKIQKQLDVCHEEIISEALKAYSLILKNGNKQNLNYTQEERLK